MGVPGKEEKLAELLAQASAEPERSGNSRRMVAPVCDRSVSATATGWSIDADNWCVIACPQSVPASEDSRWLASNDQRCLARSDEVSSLMQVDFSWKDLSLDQQTLFSEFEQTFFSNTEWHCQSVRYEIDPGTSQGFWSPQNSGDIVYRFHGDGRLLSGRSVRAMTLAGSWRVANEGHVFFNSNRVFEYAIVYGGNRFDSFQESRLKHVCKFAGEAS